MEGLLVVDKPRGRSSHDVVYEVRRISGQKRVGHAGTLDPMATGVLVLCLGAAVRITEYLIEHDKRYRARVKLGLETDTYDATGKLVATHPVNVTAEAVTQALQGFTGQILQTPPAFSAIKVGGVRQYQKARRGETVELAPRPVEIRSIDLLEIAGDEVELEVLCSKGTFIRSLAHDLGERLGTGGHLAVLRRLASGPFDLTQAHTLEELRAGFTPEWLTPIDRGLEQFPALSLSVDQARDLSNGRPILTSQVYAGPLVRAYAPDGRLLALARPQDGRLKPHKVFLPE